MNILCRGVLFLGVMTCFGMWPEMAKAADPPVTKSNILCNESTKLPVLPMPALVSDWVTIICVDAGQALAPEIKKYPQIWLTTAGTLFMLTASPPGWSRPDTLSRYDIRFINLAAVERNGAEREQVLKMWDLAFGISGRPPIERVVQLDAQSIINGVIYNIFFYTIGDRPRWIIICRNSCQSSVPLIVQDLPPK
jgi:hypothetical protein